ncbi:glutathione S-transferase [Thiopseudomonas alkaliphila]|uniref:Glutathione S-transferase n=1 Tax=Thiopseudomonas alkaliphila TaxID=1697053 RepID=A0A0K1XCH0_9GAMM|nr:glutathione S-transferase [Thiopseudomonas alkaliphila]AKX44541.1 glutathione S-transferase [Thiopseudomonas alkaliphila]AKX59031.1 glutathione S-transferase [Thiopseudomonas alkaliphila]
MGFNFPILYSFRRCPYAMRARLGILFAGLQVELREIVLRNKPAQMLAISPKGTVPVLQLPDGQVIDESLDIMRWALQQQDPQQLLDESTLTQGYALVEQNDRQFKHWLDRYKYADRYPEMTQLEYRLQGEVFLQQLEQLLLNQSFLLGDKISLADIGIMPFIRQFAHVDRQVFAELPYPNLQRWLNAWLQHPLFLQVMHKYQPWQEDDPVVEFPA